MHASSGDGAADVVGWVVAESRCICFFRGQDPSVAMWPARLSLAWLQRKHHGAQLQPGVVWQCWHRALCCEMGWAVDPQATQRGVEGFLVHHSVEWDNS